MSTQLFVPEKELVETLQAYVEPSSPLVSQVCPKIDNLTLIDGKTSLSTTTAGDIAPAGAPDVGFFYDDTRFLSHLELRVGGQPALVLSSSTEKSFVSQIELTTGNISFRDAPDLAENTIHIRREQLLDGEVLFDRFTFRNFNLKPVDLSVELCFDADFGDVFQVRGARRKVHGQYYRPVKRDHYLAFFYRGLDGILRQTLIEMKPQPADLGDRNARWELTLAPLKPVQIEVTVTPLLDGGKSRANTRDFPASLRERRHRFAKWQSHSTQFRSNHDIFDAALNTAISDFHALQIPDGNE